MKAVLYNDGYYPIIREWKSRNDLENINNYKLPNGELYVGDIIDIELNAIKKENWMYGADPFGSLYAKTQVSLIKSEVTIVDFDIQADEIPIDDQLTDILYLFKHERINLNVAIDKIKNTHIYQSDFNI
jgi:hypothetical protein